MLQRSHPVVDDTGHVADHSMQGAGRGIEILPQHRGVGQIRQNGEECSLAHDRVEGREDGYGYGHLTSS